MTTDHAAVVRALVAEADRRALEQQVASLTEIVRQLQESVAEQRRREGVANK